MVLTPRMTGLKPLGTNNRYIERQVMNVDTGELEISDIEKNFIPGFFADEWRLRHDSDLAVVYRKEESNEENADLLSFFGGLICIGGIFGAVLLFSEYHLPRIGAASILLAVVGLALYLINEKTPPADKSAAHMYFQKIEKLFMIFEIEPDEDIGKLSREQFRATVEDSLQIQASEADKAGGFDKVKKKTLFSDMHDCALEWKLCRESYATYFLVKK